MARSLAFEDWREKFHENLRRKETKPRPKHWGPGKAYPLEDFVQFLNQRSHPEGRFDDVLHAWITLEKIPFPPTLADALRERGITRKQLMTCAKQLRDTADLMERLDKNIWELARGLSFRGYPHVLREAADKLVAWKPVSYQPQEGMRMLALTHMMKTTAPSASYIRIYEVLEAAYSAAELPPPISQENLGRYYRRTLRWLSLPQVQTKLVSALHQL